jgi:ribosome-associated translation inhibitor RaiA
MNVEVHIPGAERIESLRSHIQRRLHSRIGEHADRVRRVSVRLSEFCGPARGMVWTSCRVEVDDKSLPKALVAEALEENPYRAVDNAIERLSRSLVQEARRSDRTTRDDSTFANVESTVQPFVGQGAGEGAGAQRARGSWESA